MVLLYTRLILDGEVMILSYPTLACLFYGPTSEILYSNHSQTERGSDTISMHVPSGTLLNDDTLMALYGATSNWYVIKCLNVNVICVVHYIICSTTMPLISM